MIAYQKRGQSDLLYESSRPLKEVGVFSSQLSLAAHGMLAETGGI